MTRESHGWVFNSNVNGHITTTSKSVDNSQTQGWVKNACVSIYLKIQSRGSWSRGLEIWTVFTPREMWAGFMCAGSAAPGLGAGTQLRSICADLWTAHSCTLVYTCSAAIIIKMNAPTLCMCPAEAGVLASGWKRGRSLGFQTRRAEGKELIFIQSVGELSFQAQEQK